MRRLLIACVGLLALLPLPVRADDDREELIIRADPTLIQAIADRYGLTLLRAFDQADQNLFLLLCPAEDDEDDDGDDEEFECDDDLIELIAADPDVENVVENDDLDFPELRDTGANEQDVEPALSDDTVLNYFGTTVWTAYADQPAAGLIDTEQAHEMATGAGVVAIIDTGADYDHPVLQPALIPGFDFFTNAVTTTSELSDLDPATAAVINQSTSAILEQDAVVLVNQSTSAILEQDAAGRLDPLQLPAGFGHGTMVAGLVRLVAPTATIMPLRAFRPDGTTTTFEILRAIYYAADHGADVINMSFSLESANSELQLALDYATSRGVVAVASAGNGGNRVIVYPAAFPNVIGVASTTNQDTRSLFTNYGPDLVTLAAPGEALLTTYPGGNYAGVWGTSFSTALVSGAVALLKQRNPGLDQAGATASLSAAEPVDQELGAGRLDLVGALETLPPPCATAVIPLQVSAGYAATSTGVTVHAESGCAWVASSPVSWVRPTSANGTGPGTVALTIDENPGYRRRTAYLSVAGSAIHVQQEGRPARESYLAEGATGDLTLDVAIANPNPEAAPVRVTFLRAPPNAPHSIELLVAARSRQTIRVNDIAGLESDAISTVVSSLSGLPLLVERTMSWGAGGYGGHSGTAVEAPSARWYFAEGSQGFFDTFLLLANPADDPATATVRFLREFDGEVVVTRTIAARARETVFAGHVSELVNTSFAIVVEADRPIVAERAMYWSTPDQWWAGGHGSAGVSAPASTWYFAEGATGPFFDAWLLVGNPGAQAATVVFTYLLPDGTSVLDEQTVDAGRRLTRLVSAVHPRLADTAFSVTVASDVPIVAERAMYWPGSGWREGHNSPGLVELAPRWGLAEGRVGLEHNFETYVLLANPDPTRTAQIRLTFLRETGPPVERTVEVAAGRRHTVHLGYQADFTDVPELANESFGVVVESLNAVAIAVERAMYWDAGAERWAGGSSATGIRLP